MSDPMRLKRKIVSYYATPDQRDVLELCEDVRLNNIHANVISEGEREIVFQLVGLPFPNGTYTSLLRKRGVKCDVDLLIFKATDLIIGALFFKLSVSRKNKTCWGGNEKVMLFDPQLTDIILYNPVFNSQESKPDTILPINDPPNDGRIVRHALIKKEDSNSDTVTVEEVTDDQAILHRTMISSARLKAYLPDETYIDRVVYPAMMGYSFEFPFNEGKYGR